MDGTNTGAEGDAEETATLARGTAASTPAVAIGAAAMVVGSLFAIALGLAALGYWLAA